MFMYFKGRKAHIIVYVQTINPLFISLFEKKSNILSVKFLLYFAFCYVFSIERNREPSTFAERKNPCFLLVIDCDSGCVVMRLRKQNEGRMRARIVCPVVKRSCGFEDATIFRGAFGGTQQHGSFHVSASREYRSISLSCRETSVSRLYSTKGKKSRSTVGGHWRACEKNGTDFG